MIDILNTTFIGVAFLVVWFHTEAFLEYSNLFKMKRLFKIDEFESIFNDAEEICKILGSIQIAIKKKINN